MASRATTLATVQPALKVVYPKRRRKARRRTKP
jgi:hypothetical protein